MARTPLRLIEKTLPLRTLSDDDWKHWITYGYVIVRQAVPDTNVRRLTSALLEFEDIDPHDPGT